MLGVLEHIAPPDLHAHTVRTSSDMSTSWLDHAYFLVAHRMASRRKRNFFSRGWGDLRACEAVKRHFAQAPAPAAIAVEWDGDWQIVDGCRQRDGRFLTPYFRDWLPRQAHTSYFRMVLPQSLDVPPVYVHTATTGEEDYAMREQAIAYPLARQGIGTVMLEHPFLGRRRPQWQLTSKLEHVADLLLLGGVVVEEARALLAWLRGQGFDRLGVTGISKGGHLAAMAGALTPFDIAIAPMVAPHSAVPVFTEGLLSRVCDWAKLAEKHDDAQAAHAQLREVLEFTNVQTLPPPRPGSRVIAVAAKQDYFVPRHSAESMQAHWPDAEFRWIDGGHVSSIAFGKAHFRRALVDAMVG